MLNTYLNFDGNCREAFDFYRSVFGGEFMIFQTFGDAPGEYQPPEGEQDKVMHVSFPIGDNILMGSDIPSNMGLTLVSGNNFSISVSPESREHAESLFSALSDGGAVTMPMQDMFWGSYFGSCADKFGINWQVNFEQGQD
ncbi:MAG: VOC family protein [Chloroflexi bacterium]|nr:VOC family protein [Chloroflexota bacterium]